MKPRTKLQQLIHTDIQRNKYLKELTRDCTPNALSKAHKVDHRTILALGAGRDPGSRCRLTSNEKRAIKRKLSLYRRHQPEIEATTARALQDKYGVSKRTIYKYAAGDFGTRSSPNMPETVDRELLLSSAIERFMRMRLSRTPSDHACYY